MYIKIKQKLLPWFFIFPTFFFLGMFTYYPALKSLYLSFNSMNVVNPIPVFAGLDNYISIFETPLFWQVLKNNLFYAGITIPLTLSLALILALLLNRKMFGDAIYKANFYYPNIIPMAAASMVWLYIFLPGYGILNYLFSKLGIPNIEWVTSHKYAIWALVIVAIWKNAGYYMIIFLSGLQQLPLDVYEAAEIDGASKWKQFWSITWPLLSPTTFFVFIIAVINSFQSIDQIYLMTRGGPSNATNMFVYYIYQVAFRFWDFGKASALTVILLLVLLLFTLFTFIFIERQVFYQVGKESLKKL